MLMGNPAAPIVRARKLAEAGSVLVVLVMIASTAVALRQYVADPAFAAIEEGQSWAQIFNTVVVSAVWMLPSIYLMLALWELRSAVLDCFYSHAAGEALHRAGYWSLWALFAKMLLAPTVSGVFEPGPLGLIVSFDTFDFGLIGFALLLMLAGRVLETATSRLVAEV